MNFDPKYKIEEMASQDVTRPLLGAVYLDTDSGTLRATDGYGFAIVPCSVESDDKSGLIQREGLTLARSNGRSVKRAIVRAGKTFLRYADRVVKRITQSGAYPSFDTAAPEVKIGDPGSISVSLNPELLLTVAKALGVTGRYHHKFVTLTFKPDGGDNLNPVHVRNCLSHYDKDARGCVMPCRP